MHGIDPARLDGERCRKREGIDALAALRYEYVVAACGGEGVRDLHRTCVDSVPFVGDGYADGQIVVSDGQIARKREGMFVPVVCDFRIGQGNGLHVVNVRFDGETDIVARYVGEVFISDDGCAQIIGSGIDRLPAEQEIRFARFIIIIVDDLAFEFSDRRRDLGHLFAVRPSIVRKGCVCFEDILALDHIPLERAFARFIVGISPAIIVRIVEPERDARRADLRSAIVGGQTRAQYIHPQARERLCRCGTLRQGHSAALHR